MSENVEASRRGLEAYSRGDLDACLAEMNPEVEWHLIFELPDLAQEKKVYRGRRELRALFEAFRAVWDELTIHLEEVLYDRDDLLVIRIRFRGRGEQSGIEIDRIVFFVQELRNSQLLRQRPFDTEAEAFAAAGVERGHS